MKKYFCGEKQVHLGKPFNYSTSNGRSFSEYRTENLTENFAQFLMKKGVLTLREITPKNWVPYKELTYRDCIEYYASKDSMPFEIMENTINHIADLCYKAAYCMILKAAAVLMDKNHEGHIANCSDVWLIGALTQKPYNLKVSDSTDFMQFAAFRSKEEALAGAKIVEEFFNDREQED